MNELPAGRELDALVAEKVMGWKRNGATFLSPTGLRTIEATSFGSFQPSTDIAAAWEVVGKMRGTHMLDLQDHITYWSARFIVLRGVETSGPDPSADTASLAVCRAALKALQVAK